MKKHFDPDIWVFRITIIIMILMVGISIWRRTHEIDESYYIMNDEKIKPVLVSTYGGTNETR